MKNKDALKRLKTSANFIFRTMVWIPSLDKGTLKQWAFFFGLILFGDNLYKQTLTSAEDYLENNGFKAETATQLTEGKETYVLENDFHRAGKIFFDLPNVSMKTALYLLDTLEDAILPNQDLLNTTPLFMDKSQSSYKSEFKNICYIHLKENDFPEIQDLTQELKAYVLFHELRHCQHPGTEVEYESDADYYALKILRDDYNIDIIDNVIAHRSFSFVNQDDDHDTSLYLFLKFKNGKEPDWDKIKLANQQLKNIDSKDETIDRNSLSGYAQIKLDLILSAKENFDYDYSLSIKPVDKTHPTSRKSLPKFKH